MSRAIAASITAALCLLAGEAAAGILSPEAQARLAARFERGSMVFYPARGAAHSCGPGCHEWIAAVGRFDDKTPQRLRDLLTALNGRKLPIFFHSSGGLGNAGRAVGELLREHRLTTGVGRTEPRQCRVFDPRDANCQKRIKQGEPIEARLSMGDGQCASSCVFAFAGGSRRSVAAGAVLGVHGVRLQSFSEAVKVAAAVGLPKLTKADAIEMVNTSSRWYFLRMGVDAGLAELAAKVPHERVYVLSRDEIGRFGLETRGDSFETGWASLDLGDEGFVLAKSVTRKSQSHAPEYLTWQVQVGCEAVSKAAVFRYRRELPTGAEAVHRFMQVQLADEPILVPTRSVEPQLETGTIDLRAGNRLSKLLHSRSITFTEKPNSDAPVVSSVSAAGLQEIGRRCADGPNSGTRVVPPPAP